MRRVIVVAFAVLLLVGSLSVTMVGQSQDESMMRWCMGMGFKPDVCATCFVAGITNGAQDYGACFCKYDPVMLAKFKNMGDCVQWVQKNLRPTTAKP